jgi:hypothetical protein
MSETEKNVKKNQDLWIKAKLYIFHLGSDSPSSK